MNLLKPGMLAPAGALGFEYRACSAANAASQPFMLGGLQPCQVPLPGHPWQPERVLVPALAHQPSYQQAGGLWPAQRARAGLAALASPGLHCFRLASAHTSRCFLPSYSAPHEGQWRSQHGWHWWASFPAGKRPCASLAASLPEAEAQLIALRQAS